MFVENILVLNFTIPKFWIMEQDRYSLIDNVTSNTNESGYETDATVNDQALNKPRQHFAAFAATLSALAAGAVLGWTSPIFDDLENGKFHDIKLDKNQIGWIGSFATLGGMAMCIPTGFICDLIGRKRSLLLLFVPFTVGWVLIIYAGNVFMLYFGRLITGMAAGASCIAGPLYTSEIAHKSIRGALNSYFQLMVVIGIFLVYTLGKFLNSQHLTVCCSIIPAIFMVVFVFQPESPTFLLKRRSYDSAKAVLSTLRGPNYNVVAELNEMESLLKENTQVAISLTATFRQRHVVKAFFIAVALMFFQQFSGINAVVLYTSNIFKTSGVHLDPKIASIIVGAVMVIATFISSVLVDKLGRRYLFLASTMFVTLSLLVLSIYFTIKNRTNISSKVLDELAFLPIGSLCVFNVAYSLGLGPIPWIVPAEIFPTEIKSVACSIAGTLNWFLAFVITKFFLQVSDAIGEDNTFYFFGICSFLGILFCYFFLPETKGKSIAEIQVVLRS